MAHKKICVVCGKEYEYCPRCKQYISMEKWHNRFCSEPCKNIYDIVNSFSFNHISANDANDKLNKIKVKVINEEIKNIISEIKSNVIREDSQVEEKPMVKKPKKKEIVNDDLNINE